MDGYLSQSVGFLMLQLGFSSDSATPHDTCSYYCECRGSFQVPHLKTESEAQLENDLFSLETVIDVFQLALLCDASRLAVIWHCMTSDHFKDVSSTEGWRVMKGHTRF